MLQKKICIFPFAVATLKTALYYLKKNLVF